MAEEIRLVPVESGWLQADAGVLAKGDAGERDFPVSGWVIQHPKGTVLFDSGLHADFLRDHSRLSGGDTIFKVKLSQDMGASLKKRGIDPAEIDIIIFSHLHWDHSGGTHAIPNARLMVQADEWASATKDGSENFGYNKDDFTLGHDVVQLDGEHDVFGDGSVVCMPTPGHTAGHQCLKVMLASGPVILVADCCYWEQMLEDMVLPPFGYNPEKQLAAMQKLKELRAQGAVLFFGHDKEQWLGVRERVLT